MQTESHYMSNITSIHSKDKAESSTPSYVASRRQAAKSGRWERGVSGHCFGRLGFCGNNLFSQQTLTAAAAGGGKRGKIPDVSRLLRPPLLGFARKIDYLRKTLTGRSSAPRQFLGFLPSPASVARNRATLSVPRSGERCYSFNFCTGNTKAELAYI